MAGRSWLEEGFLPARPAGAVEGAPGQAGENPSRPIIMTIPASHPRLQMTLPNGSRERRSPFCTRKGVKEGIGEWKGPFHTPKAAAEGRRVRRGPFRTPNGIKDGWVSVEGVFAPRWPKNQVVVSE